MASDLGQRLADERSIIEAMYPEQTTWNDARRELGFQSGRASFQLRLPDDYLLTALPTVLTASAGSQDLRQQLSNTVHGLPLGEEVLDTIIAVFLELVSENKPAPKTDGDATVAQKADNREATVVIWLHHLLNTNKRKLALSPASSVSGITKPGYPGVLIYSGPYAAVHDHVDELKGQNWAAFQVRLDGNDLWTFEHGKGVKEVESLGDVVKAIGEERKEDFMEAMRMK